MTNRILQMYKFIETISPITISNYFNIQDKNLDIQLNQNGNNFLLSFNYDKKIKYTQFADLPDDINREIYSFLYPNYIHVTYEISFDNGYPFVAPIWELYSIDYRCTIDEIYIPGYYNYLIENHNHQNNLDWSAAIVLEKDILELILKLNHFEYLFN